MKNVEFVRSFHHIKLLSDPRRMEILRILMASPATLSQLARMLKKSAAWVRHHTRLLEAANLIEIHEIRKTGKVIEKFYRAKAGAFILQEIISPKTKKPAIIFSGSHDLALEGVTATLSKSLTMLSLASGSMDGLVNLRQGLCQVSGAHLLDEDGEYNTSFVRYLFPDRQVELITFAHRTQGLMFAKGNPRRIRAFLDLAQPGLRFVNRNSGSGTRLWFDRELQKLEIPVEKIDGYNNTVTTHTAAAALIASGQADAALGLQAAAHQRGLDFIPLYEERYDLVLPGENKKTLQPLLDHLHTRAFRAQLESMPGYNSIHSGEQIPL